VDRDAQVSRTPTAIIPANTGVMAHHAAMSSSMPPQAISFYGALLGEVYIFTTSL
jgi:hypothetical protein